MNAGEFIQLDTFHRYDRLQTRGRKLFTLHEREYVVHIYSFDGFFVELRLEPLKFNIVSVELFSEDHPRYRQYMQKLDAMLLAG